MIMFYFAGFAAMVFTGTYSLHSMHLLERVRGGTFSLFPVQCGHE